MKQLAFIISLVLLALPAQAQMKGMDMKSDNTAATHKATGVVTKADGKGKVTIKHEPIESLKWPSMTMAFVVKDKAVADKLKPGAKVDFEFVQEGRDYVVTGVK